MHEGAVVGQRDAAAGSHKMKPAQLAAHATLLTPPSGAVDAQQTWAGQSSGVSQATSVSLTGLQLPAHDGGGPLPLRRQHTWPPEQVAEPHAM